MEYQFEGLGPDRFQQFCQALLAQLYPNVTCFPIAQPDGGRDAVVVFDEFASSSFSVFQVKYVRRPFAEAAPHQWLLDIIAQELPKIKELIPKGADKYYLLTNISGTAHLDAGSIDKVNALLQREIPISAECWWRDDLSRRLDSMPDLRWAYPELITGLDLLKQLIESGLTENIERRLGTIKAFVRDQYEIEKEVRFKQVELQNRLQDLFIDVPITLRDSGSDKARHLFHAILHRMTWEYYETEDTDPHTARTLYERDENSYLGAATFFLHPIVQKHIPVVVLEGAPGQGKSTITQYICQVHRMRLLSESADYEAISEQHKSASLRLPLRVDLRDLATWLSKKNPFSADETETPSSWHKSLEAFLAALITHHSGGIEFTAADLLAILRISAFLLVFDGLDEVADITKRQEVVDEISKGIHRLKENTSSLQVIITSRPAAFANSPGFSSKAIPHCQLESLTRNLITEYAERWLTAKKLQGPERAEVRKILKDKLDQPHLRDLAKNPMQLAILLSLIHNRGESLPDKRTELYDSYVELFFSREAQKSHVVREYRDLLINIHRYLAWVLQSEAEEGHHRGSISAERLGKILERYLAREGHDVNLSKKLFTGMVERVVALVSRVEGTYEFEVQPLREYFAARYLYETAPYSPPGSPKRGNILDRFDAISRDFYWLNVTRFYSGCFSIGELPSLAERLEELTREAGYRQTNHPRFLATTLLADWVFTQQPKSMKHVVALILDGLGLRLLLTTNNRRQRSAMPLVLPRQCGRDELITQCFSILSSNQVTDYVVDVIELIKMNTSPAEILDIWIKETLKATDQARTKWIEEGYFLGALSQIDQERLEEFISDDPDNILRLSWIFRARQFGFCESNESRFNKVVQLILDRRVSVVGNRRPESTVDLLAHVLDANRYAFAFFVRQPISLQEIWDSSRRFMPLNINESKDKLDYSLAQKCGELFQIAARESLRTTIEWSSEITPWNNLIEASRSIFGEQWINFHLANIASGIRSAKETCVEADELFNPKQPLTRRARYARLRAGNSKWWGHQFSSTSNYQQLAFGILILLTWGSAKTICDLVHSIEPILDNLPIEHWQALIRSIKQAKSHFSGTGRDNLMNIAVEDLPSSLTSRCAVALGLRVRAEGIHKIYLDHLATYNGNDPTIWGFSQRAALSLLREDPENWRTYLSAIEKSYVQGFISEGQFIAERLHKADFLSPEAAKLITENPNKYPSYLVILAESVARKEVADKIIPVGTIAKRDKWFD